MEQRADWLSLCSNCVRSKMKGGGKKSGRATITDKHQYESKSETQKVAEKGACCVCVPGVFRSLSVPESACVCVRASECASLCVSVSVHVIEVSVCVSVSVCVCLFVCWLVRSFAWFVFLCLLVCGNVWFVEMCACLVARLCVCVSVFLCVCFLCFFIVFLSSKRCRSCSIAVIRRWC